VVPRDAAVVDVDPGVRVAAHHDRLAPVEDDRAAVGRNVQWPLERQRALSRCRTGATTGSF
jgi:hypothetical protein